MAKRGTVQKSMTVEEFREYVDSIRSCGDHPIPTLTDDVLASVTEVVECYYVYGVDYADSNGEMLVRLADGRWGVFFEWSDSSGHG